MIVSIITAFLIVVLVAVSVIFGSYDDEYCALAYIDQTEAEVARLRGELEWEKAVTEAALDRHDYIAARFNVLKAENARLREALREAIPFIGYQAHVPDILKRCEDLVYGRGGDDR